MRARLTITFNVQVRVLVRVRLTVRLTVRISVRVSVSVKVRVRVKFKVIWVGLGLVCSISVGDRERLRVRDWANMSGYYQRLRAVSCGCGLTVLLSGVNLKVRVQS